MKKMLLVLVLAALTLGYADRNGFNYVVVLMVICSPFMGAYWFCVFRYCGKPEREGDMQIYEQELKKRGVSDFS